MRKGLRVPADSFIATASMICTKLVIFTTSDATQLSVRARTVFNRYVTPACRTNRLFLAVRAGGRLLAVKQHRIARVIGAALTVVVVASGCGVADDTPPPPIDRDATPAVAGSATPPEQLGDALAARYTFDDGVSDGAFTDASGNGLILRAAATDGGKVEEIPRGAGLAVRFPTPCQPTAQHRCPRTILETLGGTALNPANKRLRYGASLRLAPTETSQGSNVIQKGFATGSSQWKLQIDGAEGRPSCVIVGVVRPRIYLVVATTSIADGEWHAVTCERHGTALTVSIDGIERGRVAVPADLTIANQYPVRIGGNSANQRNDQYFGALDDAYVAIG